MAFAAVSVAQATAAPCVGATLERPFPGATDAEVRFADIPSPRFPGLWQEGTLNGFPYVLFANGEASLRQSLRDPAWSIAVVCDLDAGTCTQTDKGTPPEAARALATRMGQCFVAPDSVDVPPAPAPEAATIAPDTRGWALTPGAVEDKPTSQPLLAFERQAAPLQQPPLRGGVIRSDLPAPDDAGETAGQPATAREAAPAPVAQPCGLATLPKGAPGLTLQRLIVVAGGNPGVIDGLPGRRTRAALAEVLDEDASTLPIDQAIAALDAKLCAAAGNQPPSDEMRDSPAR